MQIYSVPTDCSKYYTCSAKTNGRYYQARYKCPDGFSYDIKTESCRPRYDVKCEMMSITELLNIFEYNRRDRKNQCEQIYTDDASIERCLNVTIPKTEVSTTIQDLTTDISTPQINVSTDQILQSTTIEINDSTLFSGTTEPSNATDEEDDDEQMKLLDASTSLSTPKTNISTEMASSSTTEGSTTISIATESTDTIQEPTLGNHHENLTESTTIHQLETTTLNDIVTGYNELDTTTNSYELTTGLNAENGSSSNIFETAQPISYETTISDDKTTHTDDSITQVTESLWPTQDLSPSTITIDVSTLSTESNNLQTSQPNSTERERESDNVNVETSTEFVSTEKATNSPTVEETTLNANSFSTNTPINLWTTIYSSTGDILSTTSSNDQSTETTSSSSSFLNDITQSYDASEFPINSNWNDTQSTTIKSDQTTFFAIENMTTEPTTIKLAYTSESTSTFASDSPTIVTTLTSLNNDSLLASSTTQKSLPISLNDTAENKNKTAVIFESTIAPNDAINSTINAINTYESSVETEKTISTVDAITDNSYIFSSSSTTQGVFNDINEVSQSEIETTTGSYDDISTATPKVENSSGSGYTKSDASTTSESLVLFENQTMATDTSTASDLQTSNEMLEETTEPLLGIIIESTTENQKINFFPELTTNSETNLTTKSLESDSLVKDTSNDSTIIPDFTFEMSTESEEKIETSTEAELVNQSTSSNPNKIPNQESTSSYFDSSTFETMNENTEPSNEITTSENVPDDSSSTPENNDNVTTDLVVDSLLSTISPIISTTNQNNLNIITESSRLAQTTTINQTEAASIEISTATSLETSPNDNGNESEDTTLEDEPIVGDVLQTTTNFSSHLNQSSETTTPQNDDELSTSISTTESNTQTEENLGITQSISISSKDDTIQTTTESIVNGTESIIIYNETSTTQSLTEITQTNSSMLTTDEETTMKYTESTLILSETTPIKNGETSHEDEKKRLEDRLTAPNENTWDDVVPTDNPTTTISTTFEPSNETDSLEILSSTLPDEKETKFNGTSTNSIEIANTTDISIDTTTALGINTTDTQANETKPIVFHNENFDLVESVNVLGQPELSIDIKKQMFFKLNFTGPDGCC